MWKEIIHNYSRSMLYIAGGLVVIVTREAIATTHEEFKDRLEPLMKQLETEGKWTFVERRIFADYLPGVNGIQYVFRKMKIAG